MLVLGDAHADDPENREALLAAYEDTDADRAIHVGDLGYYDLPIPTWFIAGNNEDFDVVEGLRARGDVDAATNAHLLASTAVEFDGLRIAGLSGNFAPTKFDEPRSALSGDRRRHFVREDVERAKDLDDVDVFLTHEAPHGLLRYGGYDPGNEHVDDILDELEPDLCLVGHHHQHRETTADETAVVGLAPVWDSYYELDTDSLALDRRSTPSP